MLPSVVKNKIEQIWLDVIAGGVSQPTEVIEQLTYLMFAKQNDEREADIEMAELFREKNRVIFSDNKEKNRLFAGETLKEWKLVRFTSISLIEYLFF